LSNSLPALLGAYAAVIERVGSEPAMHVRHRPASASDRGSSSVLGRFFGSVLSPLRGIRAWWWGFSVRPIVRLFVETHVNARTAEIGRFLRPRRLKMIEGSSHDARRLDECLRLLGYAEGMVAGWSRSLGPIRFVPPVALALSWVLVALNPEFRDLQNRLFYLVLLNVPVLMLLIYVVIIRFGFRWKRAFFTAWPSDPGQGVDCTRRLESNSASSIYELENQVYMDMGLRKHSEFPIDVILHPAPYWLLTVLVSIVIPLLSAEARGNLTIGDLVVRAFIQVTATLLFLLPTLRVIRRYRARRKANLV
jgi:hypothetical protein